MIERVKALMAKTMENGCTEAEALSALGKAQAIMDEYDIAQFDVEMDGEEVTVEGFTINKNDLVPRALGLAVGKFCHCKVWIDNRTGESCVVFMGMESDAIMARWLLEMLMGYVERALREYIAKGVQAKECRNTIEAKNGFKIGASQRICERLSELSEANMERGMKKNALVIVKSAKVEEMFAALDLRLKSKKMTRRRVDGEALAAGRKAGDGASFNRPIGNGNGPLAIGKN